MLFQTFLIAVLGSTAIASPINPVKRDSSVIVFQDAEVESAAEEKRDSAIVYQDVPVAKKRGDSNTIVMSDVEVVDYSD
ncbi:uncharacterized protein GGS25DRAFT_377498 [Hypoxylon fragiforme]|uniref:uncharacterized protein n=1 Tax=Hypoxylon fragiforme TaxID=63214 RepID=UPI0020C60B6C|nr:uncharacterized protein GGS25DRAFT_377498 [Hypoxylon fragiforme]KAI2606190.1 hypothetical protein GGS25DRAFT_377498 [Hypoxylon fragiforme]